MTRRIRTLLFSTLYPNSVRPQHGIFVETRLRHLVRSGEIEARVIAPVPWFPLRHGLFGDYAEHAKVPSSETRNGIDVAHPRYLLLPKLAMNMAPHTLARCGLTAARRMIAAGHDFDLIDAHYFYPDGVAAVIVGRALNKPVVITARGSDINLIPQYERPRRMILEAARNCAAIVTVSNALKDALVGLGADDGKITVLRNGVDLSLFYPEDRQGARNALRLAGYAIASVGNLVVAKGHDLVIGALRDVPDATLLIAGRGVERQRLQDLAAKTGVSHRVRFLGILSQPELRRLYSAVDCLVHASAREGWPNVLLEAMACGTPVAASRVGGIPEIVAEDAAGLMLEERSAAGVARAIARLRLSGTTRGATRIYAERFDWAATTEGQLSLFRAVIDAYRRVGGA
jgi:teichuronic acid biosynthesis glycosyltransferase TuaC